MYLFSVLVVCSSLLFIQGSPCDNISGLWRNQLNSNMTLFHTSATKITGEYSTAVESKFRSAIISSNITGLFEPVEDGAILGFTVLFNHGKSLATWIGQCMVCDGVEKLYTSWVLRTHLSKDVDRWMSTRINHDVFERIPDHNNIPAHLRILGPQPKDDRSGTCEKNFKVGSRGMWVDENGDAFEISECRASGVLSGISSGNEVVGRSTGDNRVISVGLTSKYEDIIRGWAGHMYEEKLHTSWIEHAFVKNCKRPFRNTNFGVHSYAFQVDFKDAPEPAKQESLLKKGFNFFSNLFV